MSGDKTMKKSPANQVYMKIGNFTAETQRSRRGSLVSLSPISYLLTPARLGLLAAAVLALTGAAQAQTYFNMSSGDYSESFTGWTNYAVNWNGLAVNATGSIPSATRITAVSTNVIAPGSSGGVQSATNSTNLQFLSTGSTVNSSSTGADLNLNFSGRNAGTISFDAAQVANSTGDRVGELKIYYSTNGSAWTELTGAGLPFTATNNVAKSASISVSLPAALNNQSTVKLRFYYYNGPSNGTGGSRPKISIDNLLVTSVSSGGTPPTITEISPTFGLGGTIVTITGTDFTGATAVRFNGVAAASFTVDSATTITATAPTGVTTGPISVTTAGGTASSTGNFTVPKLTITAPSSINEGDVSQTATVTADPAPEDDLTVNISSSSSADLRLEDFNQGPLTSVTIGAGQTTSETIYLNAPADNTVDADASVTLTATASGYNGGTAAVTVRNVDIAPISITATGTAYTQNFDELGTNNVTGAFSSTVGVQRNLGSVTNSMVGLSGWYVAPIGGSNPATTLTANDGSSTSGGVFSHGTTGANDRALGLNASGSSVFAFGAAFKNDTGVTIESFTLTLSAENWRGTTAASKLTFGYGKLGGDIIGGNFLSATGTGVTALASADITGDSQAATAALDGNTFKKSVNVTLTISVAPGETVFLRWRDFDDAGSDAALAIDDFSLTANEAVVITPPSLTGVTVDEPSLTPSQVTVSSTVVTDGGTNVTGQGFVFTPTATSADPTLTTVGAISVTNEPAVGGFTNNLTNLTAGTAYTVKSYAINSVGTNYSSPRAFSTLAAYPTFTGVYTQNFADVTNSTLIPAGWRALSSSNANSYQGSWTNTNASTGGFYGRAGNPGVLGYLHTGSTGILTNKLTLVNGTGGTLTNLFVSYAGEVNTLNSSNNLRFPAFTVEVNGAAVAALTYSTENGSNAALSTEVTGLNITTNETIVITWASERGAGSGSSRMIGLTDVRVATSAPGPTAPSNLSYSTSTVSGTVGTAISSLTPTVTGTVDTYSVSPTLPAGLSINASSGVISGTPTGVVWTSVTSTITASNAGGSTNTTVTAGPFVHFLESALGDFSGATSAPTAFALGTSSKTLLGSVTGGSDSADYLTFTVPAGYRLNAITLRAYQSTDNVAFIAIDEGATWTAGQTVSAMLGWSHFGGAGDVGTDLLAKANVAGGSLAAGTYTIWVQQLGAATAYGLEFELSALPAGSTFAGWSGGATTNSELVGKYGIGGATNISAASEKPVSAVDSNTLSLSAIVRTNDTNLTVVGEAGGSLTNWSTNGVSVTASTNTNGVPEGCQRRVFSVDRTNSPTRQFLRLKATLQP
jgi:hypothetical protein